MKLRYATVEDAGALAAFAGQAFYDSYSWYNTEHDMAAYLGSHFTAHKLIAEIGDPQTTFLLVFDDKAICGYAKLVWGGRLDINADEKQLEIARFYAGKNYIGKGVGRLMMEAAIAFAMENSAAAIWLDVWQENKKAIAFYTKWGFEVVSKWIFVLGKDEQDDFIMVKRLTPIVSGE